MGSSCGPQLQCNIYISVSPRASTRRLTVANAGGIAVREDAMLVVVDPRLGLLEEGWWQTEGVRLIMDVVGG